MPIVGIESSSRRTVPDAPLIGTATNVGLNRPYNNGRADVTFSAPSFDGGLPITSYTATAVEDPTKTATGASSPISVTGLSSATNYTFKVYATNAIGTGAGSLTSNQITATTVPQTPAAPSVSVPANQAWGSNANISIVVTAGATGGLSITSYGATSSSGNTGTSGTTTVTVSDTRGTPRTYTATVSNGNGPSSASPASSSITPSTVPNQIAQPSASAGVTSATVTWSAPDDGSSAITSYDLLNSLGGTRTGVTSPYNWTALTAGQAYTFQAKANNNNGPGAYSPSSNSVTPTSPPIIAIIATPPPIIAIIAVTPPIIAIIAVTPPIIAIIAVTPPIIAIIAVTPPIIAIIAVSPPPVCVHGDTLIRTLDGYVKARDLFIGQNLTSYTFNELPTSREFYDVETWTSNELNGDQTVPTTIEAIKVRQVAVTVMFNNLKTRRFSLEHMLLAKRDGVYMFVQAGVIRLGDYLVYDIDNHATDVIVESIGYLDEVTDVYDISVNPYDLFIAGDVIAHNKKGIFQGPTKRDAPLELN
jgi:hypothetical protein